MAGPNPWVSESVGPGWKLRICIFHRVPGDLLLQVGDYSLRSTGLGFAVTSYKKGLFLFTLHAHVGWWEALFCIVADLTPRPRMMERDCFQHICERALADRLELVT